MAVAFIDVAVSAGVLEGQLFVLVGVVFIVVIGVLVLIAITVVWWKWCCRCRAKRSNCENLPLFGFNYASWIRVSLQKLVYFAVWIGDLV